MAQIIPVDSSPNQEFQTTLNVDGSNITLRFKFRYNDIAEYWVMTIIDASTDEIVLDSIPLVTFNDPDDATLAENILSQYSYLGIGSAYFPNIGNVSDNPSGADLGINFRLVWDDTE